MLAAWSIDRARRVELVVFDERPADGEPARLEERVRHRPADQQPVDLAEEILDHVDLVRDLGPAKNRDERPIGRFEHVARGIEARAPSAVPRRPAGNGA